MPILQSVFATGALMNQLKDLVSSGDHRAYEAYILSDLERLASVHFLCFSTLADAGKIQNRCACKRAYVCGNVRCIRFPALAYAYTLPRFVCLADTRRGAGSIHAKRCKVHPREEVQGPSTQNCASPIFRF
jgi:hypothetical protein